VAHLAPILDRQRASARLGSIPAASTNALTSGNTDVLFTVAEKHARDSHGLQSRLDRHPSAARDRLGDVLRSTVQPGAQEHCEAVDRRLALAGRHRNTPSAEHLRPAPGRPPRRRGAVKAPAVRADRQDAEMERLVGGEHAPQDRVLGQNL
jgi:hypothetical protein